MSRIVGIDLGTSTSEVAYFDGNGAQLIKNTEGEVITPSVIGLDDMDQFVVGKEAQERYLLYPDKTVIEIKRKMGSGETVSLGSEKYRPAELSAKLLSYLKKSAENKLGEVVDRAVITVPAYFNNQQRQETIEAGKLAGLKVERIINEPTAAALTYGIDHMEEESYVLIYDFGGGTFDVTLLEMFAGVLDVKASNGDNQLGGKDMDEVLIDYLVDRCKAQYQVDLREDIYAMVKLKEEVVHCKIALSTQDSYEILLPMLSVKNGVAVSLQENITREVFESRIRDLVERTRRPVQQVLKDGGISASAVDNILLVGGTTRIPYVKKFVKELMGQEPVELVDPDLAVVTGAAIQAAMLNEDIQAEEGLMLTDVAPYPLGVRVAQERGFFFDTDCMDILIPRNVTIPTTRKKQYMTCGDYQTETDIEVYQGEQPKATDNYFLGKFVLSDIPPKKAGVEKIDLSFSYDLNGILQVRAMIASTGRDASITIETTNLKEEKLDTSEWKKEPLAKKFRSTIRKAEKLISSAEIYEEEDQDELEELVEELKVAVMRGQEEEAVEIEDEILDILEDYI